MTTPNIEELIADLRSRINPAYQNQRGTESYERKLCADALQSQAELIKELESEAEQLRKGHFDVSETAANLRAQLAALQVDDELPELPGPVAARWQSVPGSHNYAGAGGCAPGSFGEDSEDLYTTNQAQAYARQAQAMVRAKMVPLEKDAARYRILRDDKYQHHEDDVAVADSHFTVYFGEELDAAVDALEARHIEIDAAMGITGEPK